MIDTLKLESGPLDRRTLDAIRDRSHVRQLLMPGGLPEWELTTDSLRGSFDHRLNYRLRDLREGGTTLSFEGSVHKHILGHNCWGGPMCAIACGRYIVSRLEEHFGIRLDHADEWSVQRIDVAEVYDLGSLAAVLERLDGERQALINLTTKRKVNTYETGWATVRGKGGETRLKAYAKGPDFDVHDRKRMWKGFTDQRMANDLMPPIQEKANRLLRQEVEFYRPILKKLTDSGRLGEIDSGKLHRVADGLLSRFMREHGEEMQQVRTTRAVEARLIDVYGLRLGSLLYGLWFRLAANGEESARANMNRATYYRQRKMLLDAGCSWVNTDVHVLTVKTLVPEDFCYGAHSPYRLIGQHSAVVDALAPFAIAA